MGIPVYLLDRRQGDAAEMAIVELVVKTEKKQEEKKDKEKKSKEKK